MFIYLKDLITSTKFKHKVTGEKITRFNHKSLAILLALFSAVGLTFANDVQDKNALEQKANVIVTLYGSPDNDPPGTGDIAHPVIHKKAGGKGTFQDPITFAVKKGYLPVGKKIYYAALRKYFIMEDDCASCSSHHVDLWAGYGTKKGGILKCEDALTRESAQIIISPNSTHVVSTTPIWNESTKKCQKPFN